MAKAKRPADNRQQEFDILFDAMPDVGMRDHRDAMERPLASLAKQVRHDPFTYKFGPVEIGVQPYRDFGWASLSCSDNSDRFPQVGSVCTCDILKSHVVAIGWVPPAGGRIRQCDNVCARRAPGSAWPRMRSPMWPARLPSGARLAVVLEPLRCLCGSLVLDLGGNSACRPSRESYWRVSVRSVVTRICLSAPKRSVTMN